MSRSFVIIPAILACCYFPATAAFIPPGVNLQIRPDQTIDVAHWDRGRIYPAHVAQDVTGRDGDLVIPRGSPAELIVRQIGPGQYTIDLESITVNGQRYVLDTTGPQYTMPQTDYDRGNGVVGSILGAIAGANGEQVEPRGEHVRVPDGSILNFRLNQPLHVATWSDPDYQQNGYRYHHDQDWYR
jgi:hypothetical protein